jgi:hypothetical protein
LKKTKSIDSATLLKEANESEHRESYMLLAKTNDYRVGVGTEMTVSNQPSFFFEIVVYLCPGAEKADLQVLERGLILLKELEAKGFSLSCQDSNCISCHKTVIAERLVAEYEEIEPIIRRAYP